jgi:hypothetical protein
MLGPDGVLVPLHPTFIIPDLPAQIIIPSPIQATIRLKPLLTFSFQLIQFDIKAIPMLINILLGVSLRGDQFANHNPKANTHDQILGPFSILVQPISLCHVQYTTPKDDQ